MAANSKVDDRTNPIQIGDETVSLRVVHAIAEIEGCDPLEVPPLWDDIDPEAVDNLIASANTDVRLSFALEGYEVNIENNDISISYFHNHNE